MSVVKKFEWLDVAKGVGILLVVSGHSIIDGGAFSPVRGSIYLFHMPMFFILSGYTIKEGSFKPFFWKKIWSLIVPYISYLIIIGVPVAAFSHTDKHRSFLVEFLYYIYGGAHLVTFMTVFWFVTCLFFAQLLFQRLLTFFKSAYDPKMLGAIFFCCVVSYLVSWGIHFPTPLAIGVVPMAIVFLWAGRLLPLVEKRPLATCLASLGVVVFALGMCQRIPPYIFDMKNALYGPAILGVIVAVALSLLVIFASRALVRVKAVSIVLQALGRASLTIMFLSQPIVLVCEHFGVGYAIRVILAVAVPFFAHMLFERNKYSGLIFLGRKMGTPNDAPGGALVG